MIPHIVSGCNRDAVCSWFLGEFRPFVRDNQFRLPNDRLTNDVRCLLPQELSGIMNADVLADIHHIARGFGNRFPPNASFTDEWHGFSFPTPPTPSLPYHPSWVGRPMLSFGGKAELSHPGVQDTRGSFPRTPFCEVSFRDGPVTQARPGLISMTESKLPKAFISRA